MANGSAMQKQDNHNLYTRAKDANTESEHIVYAKKGIGCAINVI